MNFDVKTEKLSDDQYVISLAGEVDLYTAPEFKQQLLEVIDQGGPYPYSRDGVVFGNLEKILPKHDRGYYHEFTVKTPGEKDRGAECDRTDIVADVAGFDPAVVEKIRDDSQEVLLALSDPLEVVLLLRLDWSRQAEAQQLGVASNGVERCAELVRHRCQKFALGGIGRLRLRDASRVGY